MPNNSFSSSCVKLLETLKQELPLCFKYGSSKQPLKIAIHKDVVAYYQKDNRHTPKMICRAIGMYTNSKAYLKSLEEGAERIDLEGKVVDKVTLKQAEYAKKLLKIKYLHLKSKHPSKEDNIVTHRRRRKRRTNNDTPLLIIPQYLQPLAVTSKSSSFSSSTPLSFSSYSYSSLKEPLHKNMISVSKEVFNKENIKGKEHKNKEVNVKYKEIVSRALNKHKWPILSLKKPSTCKK